MKIIAFFNNKGGVGKTTLAYHLAWMYAELGVNVLAADLDPQANLTSMFLDEDKLEEIWSETSHQKTIVGAVKPLNEGTSDVKLPFVEEIPSLTIQEIPSPADNLGLIVGDLALSSFEDELSSAWIDCFGGRKPRAFRVMSAFYRLLQQAGEEREAELVLVDVGPNLGAINRAALLAADFVVVPLAPDLFSLQGLRNLGPTLRDWRKEWQTVLSRKPSELDLTLPSGNIQPAGYVVLQQPIRLDRPVKAYGRWMAKIPTEYAHFVLDQEIADSINTKDDPNSLAVLKNYRSLMPLAMEAHKTDVFT